MSDHYHAINDTKNSIQVLHILEEILKDAPFYELKQKMDLNYLTIEVGLEANRQKDLLIKLGQTRSLGRAYKEELKDINIAYNKVITIKDEIADTSYGKMLDSINDILNLLKNNRNYIEELLKPQQPEQFA